MKKLNLILSLAVFVIISCHKEPSFSVKLKAPFYLWSEYMGTYDVYDTINHTQWVMKITHLWHSDLNGGNQDSVLIENFANLFTMRDTWSPCMDNHVSKPCFTLKGGNPVFDRYGFRWALNGAGDDLTTSRAENVLINDTIIMNYQQSNIAWYIQDGVPYQACTNCKHIAVKRPN